MAELLFDNSPGLVRVMQLASGSAPGLISVRGKSGNLTGQNSVIIQSIGVSQEVQAQFMVSLQKLVYIYCFGDRPGQITVTGLAFDSFCLGNAGSNDPFTPPPPFNFSATGLSGSASNAGGGSAAMAGVDTIMSYYTINRAVAEDNIIKVLLGKTSFQGYLISMNMQTANTEQKMFQFTLTIWTVPNKVGPDGSVSSTSSQDSEAGESVGAITAANSAQTAKQRQASLQAEADAFNRGLPEPAVRVVDTSTPGTVNINGIITQKTALNASASDTVFWDSVVSGGSTIK